MRDFLRGTDGRQASASYLEVTMEDVGGMQVLESPQDLVKEVLEVLVGEWLVRTDDAVQVGFLGGGREGGREG